MKRKREKAKKSPPWETPFHIVVPLEDLNRLQASWEQSRLETLNLELRIASRKGDLGRVQTILQNYPEDKKSKTLGFALGDAAQEGKVEVVEFLLSQITHDTSLYTGVTQAARVGNRIILETIFKKIHNVYTVSSALCAAASCGITFLLYFLFRPIGAYKVSYWRTSCSYLE